MKACLGLLVALLCLSAGCVAIPPLITVNHEDKGGNEVGLRNRVDQLERRVRELEEKQERR
jgi:hypothetical protein